MHLIYIQLDFKPADIQHSSLRTMAKHVRRAMLPGNHEVFKKSFTEGKICLSCCIKTFDRLTIRPCLQNWTASRTLIFTGQILLMP